MENVSNRNCILVGVTADFDDLVTYNGVLGWGYSKRNRYVKSVDDEFNVTYTGLENEAYRFYDDVLATKTMRAMLKDENFKNTHILVWEYERSKPIAQSVHYPNEHWGRFNNLQPVLMNHTVAEYDKNPY